MTHKLLLKVVLAFLVLGFAVLAYVYMNDAYAVSSPYCRNYPPGGGVYPWNHGFSCDWINCERTYDLTGFSRWNGGHISFHVEEAGSVGGGFTFLRGDGSPIRGYPLYGHHTDFWTDSFDLTGPNAVIRIKVYGSSISYVYVNFDQFESNHPGGNTCMGMDAVL